MKHFAEAQLGEVSVGLDEGVPQLGELGFLSGERG